jgi:uncharacterized protein
MKLKPISKGTRIEAVDALRGFALLGVLMANIPIASPEMIAGSWDSILTFLAHLLIDKKFIAIFSILFGFGFYIQMSRAAEKGVDFKRYFSIRMILLFVIGTLHSYLVWNGDIIMSYAFGGFFLLLIRKWSVKKLVLLAVLFNVLLTGFFFIANDAFGWQIYDYDYDLAKEFLITPSFSRYLQINFIMNPWTNFFKDMPITLVYTFGNMLVGFILGKINFFHFSIETKKIRTYFIVLGSTLGIFSSYLFHQITVGALELTLSLIWIPFLLAAGMILQSLFYISLFLFLYQNKKAKNILQFFNIVGRTALSNYILQSFFYLFIFFHCTHTFQLFEKITMGETYLLGVGLFILQTLLSYLWLKNHSQGPLEFIWKKISYRAAE